ncbi:MAG: hypothetical protein U5N53_22255 [Mycobacterium sp.]|nr:hypothetical protein [Mycobacterium sp.]
MHQRHPDAVGARYRADRRRGHLGEHLRQPEAVGHQTGQPAQPGLQVGGGRAALVGCRGLRHRRRLHQCRVGAVG